MFCRGREREGKGIEEEWKDERRERKKVLLIDFEVEVGCWRECDWIEDDILQEEWERCSRRSRLLRFRSRSLSKEPISSSTSIARRKVLLLFLPLDPSSKVTQR